MCSISIDNDAEETNFKIEKVDLNLCTHIICIDNIWSKTIGKKTFVLYEIHKIPNYDVLLQFIHTTVSNFHRSLEINWTTIRL